MNKKHKRRSGKTFAAAALALLLCETAVSAVSQRHTVYVRPDEKTVAPIPMEQFRAYAGILSIKPEEPYNLAHSSIIEQDEMNVDEALWYRITPQPQKQYEYLIEGAYSGQEWLRVSGTFGDDGKGKGKGQPPKFEVAVPEIDIDWAGVEFERWEYEKDEEKKALCLSADKPRRFIIIKPKESTLGWKGKELPNLRLKWDDNLVNIFQDEACSANKRIRKDGDSYTINSSIWTGRLTLSLYAKLVENNGASLGEQFIRIEREKTSFDEYSETTWDSLHYSRIELKNSAATPQYIGHNGFAYITAAPQMPQLQARLRGDTLEGDTKWQLKIEYNRPNRGAFLGDVESFPGPNASDWKTLPATATWNIAQEFGTKFRGGKATLTCEYQGEKAEHIFHIRGSNPAAATAKAYLDASGFWFAYCIAKHESGSHNSATYWQFNESGTLGINEEQDIRNCPNRSNRTVNHTYGWGIMQLDTLAFPSQNRDDDHNHVVPCAQELWSWTANCDIAIQVLLAKREEMLISWRRNASDGNGGYIMPPDITVQGVSFTANGLYKPEDIDIIKRYNGGRFWTYNKQEKKWTHVAIGTGGNGDYTEMVLIQHVQ